MSLEVITEMMENMKWSITDEEMETYRKDHEYGEEHSGSCGNVEFNIGYNAAIKRMQRVIQDYQGEFFDEYQEKVLSFARYPDEDDQGKIYTALGLTGESGEVAEKIKKMMRDGTYDDMAIAKELGDVLWYLSAAAHENGFTLSEIAKLNVRKLTDRYDRGVLQGSGDER